MQLTFKFQSKTINANNSPLLSEFTVSGAGKAQSMPICKTSALTCPEMIWQRPCTMWKVETQLIS